MKKAVILGVGPEAGLGSQLALRFARDGMHVLGASRTPSALEKLVAKIRESKPVEFIFDYSQTPFFIHHQ